MRPTALFYTGKQPGMVNYCYLLLTGLRQEITNLAFYKALCLNCFRQNYRIFKKAHLIFSSLFTHTQTKTQYVTFSDSIQIHDILWNVILFPPFKDIKIQVRDGDIIRMISNVLYF